MKTTLEILAEIAKRAPLRLLLVGGYALPFYGIFRQTLDVDCLIAESDREGLGSHLAEAGYSVRAQTENFIRFGHESVSLMHIDALVVGQDTFEEMFRQSQDYPVGSHLFHVPTLVHLIALKLHAVKNNPRREARDLADIVELLRANANQVTGEELEKLCRRYGPEGVFQKLRDQL